MKKSESLKDIRVQTKGINKVEFEAVKETLKGRGWNAILEEDGPHVHNLHYTPPRVILNPLA